MLVRYGMREYQALLPLKVGDFVIHYKDNAPHRILMVVKLKYDVNNKELLNDIIVKNIWESPKSPQYKGDIHSINAYVINLVDNHDIKWTMKKVKKEDKEIMKLLII
jgi:hypothetical protein